MLTATTLRGNWATLLLPIDDNEQINYGRLKEEIDFMIAAKVDGIYSNGTAGEFHNQTEAEFDQINGLLADKCKQHHIPFQIGASHPSPIISLQRLRRGVILKPAAFQVILPDWVKVTFEEQVSFLQRMADEAEGIPLVLYNPPHAKQVLTPIEIAKLKEKIPTLIGMKLLSGDAKWVETMKEQVSNLSIFVPGHFLATGVHNQIAHGAYSNVACINPKAAQLWWEMMHIDLERALDIEKRIQEFFRQCIAPLQQRGYSNPALDKFLAAVGGWGNVGTRLRWPYQWISEAEVPAARAIAKEIIPEFF
jgi:4-hydroxy-tetrahydrodipicolinate synthase